MPRQFHILLSRHHLWRVRFPNPLPSSIQHSWQLGNLTLYCLMDAFKSHLKMDQLIKIFNQDLVQPVAKTKVDGSDSDDYNDFTFGY